MLLKYIYSFLSRKINRWKKINTQLNIVEKKQWQKNKFYKFFF